MSKGKQHKGKFCAVYGCSNYSSDNVSLHLFPRADKRPGIRKQWIAFVKCTRKDFDNPSEFTCICEEHFEKTCYPLKYRVMKNMGKEEEIKRKDLLPDAVPTIYPPRKTTEHDERKSGEPSCSATPTQTPKAPRSAYRKRECDRVRINLYIFYGIVKL